MTEEYALALIPERMQELGFGDNYIKPKFRHFTLYGGEIRKINAYNEFFFLLSADIDISLTSEFGSYNLTDDTINEQLHEHQGELIITNNNEDDLKSIIFLQVIPKHI